MQSLGTCNIDGRLVLKAQDISESAVENVIRGLDEIRIDLLSQLSVLCQKLGDLSNRYSDRWSIGEGDAFDPDLTQISCRTRSLSDAIRLLHQCSSYLSSLNSSLCHVNTPTNSQKEEEDIHLDLKLSSVHVGVV